MARPPERCMIRGKYFPGQAEQRGLGTVPSETLAGPYTEFWTHDRISASICGLATHFRYGHLLSCNPNIAVK